MSIAGSTDLRLVSFDAPSIDIKCSLIDGKKSGTHKKKLSSHTDTIMRLHLFYVSVLSPIVRPCFVGLMYV